MNHPLDKKQQEQYIASHPLSLFPDLVKEKMAIETFDEHNYKPIQLHENTYQQLDYIHSIFLNIGVFRWNSVEPFRKWVSALTAYRTPSTDYGPEHPVLLDRHYPISYWTCLQKETETALDKVGVLMKCARSWELVSKRFIRSNPDDDEYVDDVFRLCINPISDTIRILLEMTHSLEQQLKRISPIIRDQITMTNMATKTNIHVVPLILSYM